MKTFPACILIIAGIALGGCAQKGAATPAPDSNAVEAASSGSGSAKDPATVEQDAEEQAGLVSDYDEVMAAVRYDGTRTAGFTPDEAKWDDVAQPGKRLRVKRIVCEDKAGKPAHCHQGVRRGDDGVPTPVRWLTVAKTEGSSFEIRITTEGTNEKITCSGLTQGAHSQVLVGKCIVDPDEGTGAEHYFAAMVKQGDNPASKLRKVKFAFRHSPLSSPEEEIHAGSGHADEEPGG